MKIYHCQGARSLRAVWTAEEMGLDYELVTLPFPPRVFEKDFLAINPLGTIPFFVDGETRMTESSGISHYLARVYGPTPIALDPDDPEYGAWLNWMYQSDATLTFPQTLFLRYTRLEPEERRNEQVATDYSKWFGGRLRWLEQEVVGRDFLVAGRFTTADICIGYALHLATSLGLDSFFKEETQRYWHGLQQVPSYQKVRDL